MSCFPHPSEPNLKEKTERENMGAYGGTLRCQELNTKKGKK